nr:CusA/CzcA family heavy metal efflux RND transporter [Saprospiraceae bacterium]
MLNRVIDFSVNNKLIIGLMVIALIVIGVYQATKLPIDAVPDITNNQVLVITQAPAYGATDIERLVTFPIEQANSNIAGLKEIRSFSRFGLSLVTMVFEDDVDVYWARQQVSEKLLQAKTQIPQGIGDPELGPISTGLGEIYQYVVRPQKGFEKKYNAVALRTIQDWIIRRQLLGVKGVAEVSSFGGKLKQYEIAVMPDKLNAYGITINDVFNALEQNNQNTGGAYIEKGPTVLYIRSEGLAKSIEDIQNITIKKPDASVPLFLRDVAEVKTGAAVRYGAVCYNDQGEVAGAIVMMLKGANSSAVIKSVKERIEQIKKTMPEGVVIEPFLDRTKMVNNAIGTVEKNLLEGALIVVFILVLFLGNLRAGLLVASVIPLAMLFAICMMNLFGVSGNLMSLGALDFGLIVDGAVIIVEAVLHQIQHTTRGTSALSNQKMNETVASSSKKMMNSSVFGQLIILIVYLPIFSLQGIEGKMFKPMAQTVAFALLGAFLLSLTYIPMMSALVLSNRKQKVNFSDKMMSVIEAKYQGLLFKALQFPKVILAFVLILFIAAVFILTKLGGEFIPALEEGDFAVDTRVLTGSNLNTTIEFTQKAAKTLKTKFPEVEKVVTKIGSGEVPTDPMPMEAADMMVILKDKSEWTSAKTFNELSEKMGKVLEDVPGVTFGFQYPVQMRFNELMTGARQDVVCKIFGENLDTLAAYADILGKQISTIQGAKDLYIEPIDGMPQVVIEYNRQAIAQYHLSIADVNRIINIAFAGQTAGQIFEDEKRFDVVVRLNADAKKNIDDIRNLLVPNDDGMQIPLNQLAEVEVKQGVNQIQREDAKRRIVVGFNVKGRDVQSIVKELQQKVNTNIKFPTGYYTTYGGAFENLEKATKRLMIAVPISLLLIFVLLFFAFKNVKQGVLIYTAIPLSAIGGILFLALRGMPFSISAGVGFIALFGVAVLNGIVLISEFNRLKSEGITSLTRIVLSGTKLRLRPVLMTALVASLGFLPMALSNGSGAEVQRPLATVVIGGLLIATLLTLFVLPLLYIISEKGLKNKKMKSINSILVIAFALFASNSNGQTTLKLHEAIAIAIKNNTQLKNQQLKAAYVQTIISAAKEIPKTNIFAELGQVNSVLFDSKFGIAQTIPFPSVFKKQKQVYEADFSIAKANVVLKEYELKKAIAELYCQYQFLKDKEALLVSSDSLFTAFYNKAALRLQKGESNILEKITAENQKQTIEFQLQQLRQAINVVVIQFQYLLNQDDVVPFYETDYTYTNLDTLQAVKHPALQIFGEEIKLAAANTALEKARLNPDFNIGINNTSFSGVASNNVTYNGFNRFTSVQLGAAIPIFAKSQKQKVKALQAKEKIAESNASMAEDKYKTELNKWQSLYQSNLALLNTYKATTLQNAAVIKQTANQQFSKGEINYLDYVMLIHQAISIDNN